MPARNKIDIKASQTMDSGSYLLIIHTDSTFKQRIGALDELCFESGYYVYVGSALRGLNARIKRHRAAKKNLHWHIDYLLAHPASSIIDTCKFSIPECELSREVARYAPSSVPGFGCSDCKCKSHLYFFKRHPGDILRTITTLKEQDI